MTEQQKKNYPMLPIAHWWALRKKFKQSIPGVVTDGYLATVLNMDVKSARANVLPFLKALGIIDDEGKTSDRARQWRDDEHYPGVCEAILSEVYPTELREAVTDVGQRAQATRWFSNATGGGESAVSRMVALFMVLLNGDATQQSEKDRADTARKAKKEPVVKRSARIAAAPIVRKTEIAPQPGGASVALSPKPAPGININLQIHISADSTADQIDQIFASMAKHIYRNG